MGLMDKVKDKAKEVDTKLGNSIDKSKLDSQIRDEERAIEKAMAEIGQKVVDAIEAGKTAAEADVQALYDKIKAAKDKIEELKKLKEEIDSKV
ncbi:MAG: hypothetical protein Q4Q58_02360 [Thermoplasmata archaeon]|nr:hypothetical protein [Thermoplasmata archaeon]